MALILWKTSPLAWCAKGSQWVAGSMGTLYNMGAMLRNPTTVGGRGIDRALGHRLPEEWCINIEKDRGHGKVVMGKTKYLLNIVLIT